MGKDCIWTKQRGRIAVLEVLVPMLKALTSWRDTKYELFHQHSQLDPLLEKHRNSRMRDINVKSPSIERYIKDCVCGKKNYWLKSVCLLSFPASLKTFTLLSNPNLIYNPGHHPNLYFFIELSGSVYVSFQLRIGGLKYPKCPAKPKTFLCNDLNKKITSLLLCTQKGFVFIM